jgi:hypothetical protein
MMATYYRASDMLPPAVIDTVMKYLVSVDPDWKGGKIYFPSVSSSTGLFTTDEIILKRAQAVVFTEDGFTIAETAARLSVSIPTIKAWKRKYGPIVRPALQAIREHKEGADND